MYDYKTDDRNKATKSDNFTFGNVQNPISYEFCVSC